VFLEQRPTHVAVQTVREMVGEIAQSPFKNLRFGTKMKLKTNSTIIATKLAADILHMYIL